MKPKNIFVNLVLLTFVLLTEACDDGKRNAYMLHKNSGVEFGIVHNPLNTDGYDWWWHSLVAIDRETGKKQPFFIEYFVMNPGLGGEEPILGQLPENKERGIRPSYAMVKAGTWAHNGARQINNFYPITDFEASLEEMDVRIGNNIATETRLKGSAKLSAEESLLHPEYMSDAGEMAWDLEVESALTYSVGYAASEILRDLNAFGMFWHVHGMKNYYSGTITYNGRIYDVIPEESHGYQDKNWGTDYTNPWIWLNCNNFSSRATGEKLEYTSLDVGGGVPEVFGIPLGRKVLIAFYHEGELYEFNFSKLWRNHNQQVDVDVKEDEIVWDIVAQDADSKLEILFKNPKSKMLKIHYENPRGEKNHHALWNGGHAEGTVKLYHRSSSGWSLVDTFDGSFGGSEFGEY